MNRLDLNQSKTTMTGSSLDRKMLKKVITRISYLDQKIKNLLNP